MADPPDDDPATIDWGPNANTDVDERPPVAEADTAKYRSLDFARGFEDGFTRGVNRVIVALTSELTRDGASPAEAFGIATKVRARAVPRG